MKPFVSVIIPTFRRAPFLKYALDALKRQSYKNFEIIVVVKPADDETEEILRESKRYLSIKIIIQPEEFVSKAYNLGLEEAKGDIIAIMDDDSVPYPNWLEQHLEMYIKNNGLGAVSGSALDAKITKERKLKQAVEDIHRYKRWQEYYHSPWSYNRPLTGMSDWWIYFGKDGLVHQRPPVAQTSLKKAVPSLLFMGANMSVKREAIEKLKIQEELILGFSYEQLLAYQIWRQGYRILHNPNIKVLHIVHSESLGRFFQTRSRAAHRDAEYILSFFFLKPYEQEVSWPPYILELISLILSRILSIRNYGLVMSMSRVYGLLYGFVVGCAASISRFLGGKFSVKNSLLKFVSDKSASNYI